MQQTMNVIEDGLQQPVGFVHFNSCAEPATAGSGTVAPAASIPPGDPICLDGIPEDAFEVPTWRRS